MPTVDTGLLEVKSLDHPDETRTLPKTKVEIVNVAGHTLIRATFAPGWKWSECIKPTVKTPSCQVSHLLYVISGKFAVRMDDGTQQEIGPGCAGAVAPGHDLWVVGNEPCVAIDFGAGPTYATASKA